MSDSGHWVDQGVQKRELVEVNHIVPLPGGATLISRVGIPLRDVGIPLQDTTRQHRPQPLFETAWDCIGAWIIRA